MLFALTLPSVTRKHQWLVGLGVSALVLAGIAAAIAIFVPSDEELAQEIDARVDLESELAATKAALAREKAKP